MTITLTSDADGTNIVASPSTNSIPAAGTTITIVNNVQAAGTGQAVYVFQMPILSQLPPGTGSRNVQPLNGNNAIGQALTYNDVMKAYLGFTLNTEPGGLFANVPTDDSWFLVPPSPGAILPIRIQGLIDVVLTPQHDPNPPHSLHPVVTTISNGGWNAANSSVMWILNSSDAGKPVNLYVKYFFNNGDPSAYYTYPLSASLCYYTFPPTANSNIAKFWYGFAFAGEYNGAEAYFAAHPLGASHHTGELPPADSETREGGTSNADGASA